MHPVQRSFAVVLRRRRLASGFSQEALAARAELHRNYVGMLERAQRVPTLVVVQRLAAALGTTMGELITEVEAEPPAKGKARHRTGSSD